MLGFKTARKGCFGCVGLIGGAFVLFMLVWLFAPGVIDAVIDWVLYVEPPKVAVSEDGANEVKQALRKLYVSVEGDGPSKADEIVLTEGALNGLLGNPSETSALRESRVDLGLGDATLYGAIDLKRLAKDEDYRDLMADVPSFLRERRVSVRVHFTGLSTVGDRLRFDDASVTLGRVWVPFSGAWVLPVLQRVAERKLGTRLPDEGLPLPPNSAARIADDRLTVKLGAFGPR